MSPIEELIHTIDRIRSIPAWEPAAINAALAVELQRMPTTTPRYKLYQATLAAPFTRVRLDRPVQAGPTKWSVSISIHQDVSIGFKELRPRLPAIDKLVPPMMPTPGGPPIWSHSVLVSYPECGGSFRFEAVHDLANDRLVEFALARPAPAEAPDHYAPKHFRAYRIAEGADEHFVIERTGSHSETLRVSELKLSQRTLSVPFLIKDIALGDEAAQVLIKEVLLKGMLNERFAGNVDQIVFTDTEIGATETASW
ncbi:MAG: hypothetical protein ACOY0T_29000 [Myxococcota bacterium]